MTTENLGHYMRKVLAILAILPAAALVFVSPRLMVPGPSSVVLRVDPNTAPAEVLEALPSLGPARVRAILAAREEAPFTSLVDLDVRVKGIGPAIAADLAPHLRFDPPQPPRP